MSRPVVALQRGTLAVFGPSAAARHRPALHRGFETPSAGRILLTAPWVVAQTSLRVRRAASAWFQERAVSAFERREKHCVWSFGQGFKGGYRTLPRSSLLTSSKISARAPGFSSGCGARSRPARAPLCLDEPFQPGYGCARGCRLSAHSQGPRHHRGPGDADHYDAFAMADAIGSAQRPHRHGHATACTTFPEPFRLDFVARRVPPSTALTGRQLKSNLACERGMPQSAQTRVAAPGHVVMTISAHAAESCQGIPRANHLHAKLASGRRLRAVPKPPHPCAG